MGKFCPVDSAEDVSQQWIDSVLLHCELSACSFVPHVLFFCLEFCFSFQGRQMADDDNNRIFSNEGLYSLENAQSTKILKKGNKLGSNQGPDIEARQNFGEPV